MAGPCLQLALLDGPEDPTKGVGGFGHGRSAWTACRHGSMLPGDRLAVAECRGFVAVDRARHRPPTRRAHQGGLAARRWWTDVEQTDDASVVGRLTTEANSGWVPPPGTSQACPADFGKYTDAYFVYSDDFLWLWVNMGGCTPIIDRYGWSEDRRLVQDLQGLLGS